MRCPPSLTLESQNTHHSGSYGWIPCKRETEKIKKKFTEIQKQNLQKDRNLSTNFSVHVVKINDGKKLIII